VWGDNFFQRQLSITDSIIIILYFFAGVSISKFFFFFNKISNIDLPLLFHYRFPTLGLVLFALVSRLDPKRCFYFIAVSRTLLIKLISKPVWTHFCSLGGQKIFIGGRRGSKFEKFCDVFRFFGDVFRWPNGDYVTKMTS